MNKITTVKVLKVRHLTESTFVLRVERKGFEFIPGQCVNLGLPKEAINREYSTYSGKDEKYLEFLIKTIADGALSPKLQTLKPGNEITIDGAYGLFTIPKPEDMKNKYVFIGTGTGVAPFHSFALSYPNLEYKVIHGVSFKNELYDAKDYPKGRYISCVTREHAGDFQGRVTEYLLKNPVNPKNVFYLCGNSDMINDVYDILRSQNVNGTNIITEVFF